MAAHLDASPTMAEPGRNAYPAPVRNEPLRIALKGGETISAILVAPRRTVAGYVLAHGAGRE